MHTFSPAKMWIAGLTALKRPLLHLHTQFNRDIPWSSIDMDFMNLNQSAHGGREFGFMCSRLRQNRKVIVGHWEDPQVQQQLGDVVASGSRLARLAACQNRSTRRQHARGGGYRGGQSCGADPVRVMPSTAMGSATWSASWIRSPRLISSNFVRRTINSTRWRTALRRGWRAAEVVGRGGTH